MRKKFIEWLAKVMGVRLYTQPLYSKQIVLPDKKYDCETIVGELEVDERRLVSYSELKANLTADLAKKLIASGVVEWHLRKDHPIYLGTIVNYKLIVVKKLHDGK